MNAHFPTRYPTQDYSQGRHTFGRCVVDRKRLPTFDLRHLGDLKARPKGGSGHDTRLPAQDSTNALTHSRSSVTDAFPGAPSQALRVAATNRPYHWPFR